MVKRKSLLDTMKKVEYPITYFNKKQLENGTKIEMEHTTSRRVARNIAEQHLIEGKNYYKLLKSMEHKLIKSDKFKINKKVIKRRY